MRRWRWMMIAGLALAVGVLALHNVSGAATDADNDYGERILGAAGYIGPRRAFGDLGEFESQIKAIAAVQDAVLHVAPGNTPIPFDRGREPKDLFELKYGLCFDRSRVIEKMLEGLGLETRHVAVYSTRNGTWVSALLTVQIPSHAVTEVKTAKGWMVVDSNGRWMGLTAAREPVAIAALRSMPLGEVRWAPESSAPINPIFLDDFIHIRGLYSRHGRFFAPFTPIPDLNYAQFMSNVFD